MKHPKSGIRAAVGPVKTLVHPYLPNFFACLELGPQLGPLRLRQWSKWFFPQSSGIRAAVGPVKTCLRANRHLLVESGIRAAVGPVKTACISSTASRYISSGIRAAVGPVKTLQLLLALQLLLGLELGPQLGPLRHTNFL